MDLPVDIEDSYDDGCKNKINESDSQVETSDCEIETSMSVHSDQMLNKGYDTIKIMQNNLFYQNGIIPSIYDQYWHHIKGLQETFYLRTR